MVPLLYKHGSLAVELFFCISGFIFFWLYSEKIAQHKMSALRFLWIVSVVCTPYTSPHL